MVVRALDTFDSWSLALQRTHPAVAASNKYCGLTFNWQQIPPRELYRSGAPSENSTWHTAESYHSQSFFSYNQPAGTSSVMTLTIRVRELILDYMDSRGHSRRNAAETSLLYGCSVRTIWRLIRLR